MTSHPTLPDTPLVSEAMGLALRAMTPALVHHSQRTFLLGAAWATKRKLAFDAEGLALAALFHDLGLCREYANPANAFTFASGRALRIFLEERGVPQVRIEPLVDAITFHMQVFPAWSRGPEAGLLQVGAWMDLTGLRRWSVWSDAREIARRHPRQGIDLSFPLALVRHSWRPRSCLGLLLPERVEG
jgi:hypothetical protein